MTGHCSSAGPSGSSSAPQWPPQSNLTPTYPLQLAGYTFPGYTALYTVILNILVTIVLTPVFNAMAAQRTPLDETVASDYYA